MTHWQLPTAVEITEIHQENYRTKTFVLNAHLDAYPGQFIMAWLPRFDEKPFSLVNNDPVTLMVTAVGPFSNLLHAQNVGDHIWLRGPFGQGFRIPNTQRRLALIGGGYGVAPLLWLARTQQKVAEQIVSVVGARTAADILYTKYFAQLASPPREPRNTQHATRNTHLTTTEDGSAGTLGRVTDVLEPMLAAGDIDGICACGPHGMLVALQHLGQRYGTSAQLSWEAYMRCGIGICGACEHDGRVLCLDGPVISSQ